MVLNLVFRRVAFFALLLSLGSCSRTLENQATQPPADAPAPTRHAGNTPLTVVATHTVLCDLVKQIAARTVSLKCLIAPGADPHAYQPTPDDRKAIETAKLLLYGGYNFEPEIIKLIEATSNTAPKVAVDERAVPTPQKFEEDGKTLPDPHVFHNALNGVRMANVIRDELSELQPSQAPTYKDNAEKLTAELTRIDSWIKSQIANIPPASRKLVTTHDAFGYYSRAYGIPIEGALEGISTEEAPTAARVKELVGTIETTKVPTIFAELTINPKLIEAVAREAKVKVADRELFADGLGEANSEGNTYQKMLIANTRTIVQGLGGRFTPLQPLQTPETRPLP